MAVKTAGLPVQTKLALMMTSAGSMRALSSIVGVSHQRIGRWLTIGQTMPDGSTSHVTEPTDPGILEAIDIAFEIHADVSRGQAKRDKIPFSETLPVFAQRLPLSDGTPGDRVVISHTHRLNDDVRNAVIAQVHRTKKYYSISIRSLVNLRKYNNRADSDYKKKKMARNRDSWRARESFKIDEKDGINTRPVFTPYTSLNPGFPSELVSGELTNNLRQRHQPATGEKGTAYADEILLQVDTRKDKTGVLNEQRRQSAARERAAIYAKTRRNKP